MSRPLLNIPFSFLYRKKFREFRVSPTANINLSRIRGGTDCSFTVGEESHIRAYIAFQKPGASVRVGARTFIGKARIMAATEVVIEDDVLISWDVTIVDNNSHSVRFSERSNDVREWSRGRKDWQHVKLSPVRIQSKAWIGFGASILSGVTIGAGAIIGASSVITVDVPPWTIWAGNPARLIRELSADER
jgi:acetyltransferase-like isoleucine patch superfamily enzyme